MHVFNAVTGKNEESFSFRGRFENGDAVGGNSTGDAKGLVIGAPHRSGWVKGEVVSGVGGLANGKTKILPFDWRGVALPLAQQDASQFTLNNDKGVDFELVSVTQNKDYLVIQTRVKKSATVLPRDVLFYYGLTVENAVSHSLEVQSFSFQPQPTSQWTDVTFFHKKDKSQEPLLSQGPLHLRGEIRLSSRAWQTRPSEQYFQVRFWLPPVPTDNVEHPSNLPVTGYAHLRDENGNRVQISQSDLRDLRQDSQLATTIVREKPNPDWRYELAQIVLKDGKKIVAREPWPIFGGNHLKSFYIVYPRGQLRPPHFPGIKTMETQYQQVRSRAVSARFGPFEVSALRGGLRLHQNIATPQGALQLRWLQLPPLGAQRLVNNQRHPLALWFEYKSANPRLRFVPQRIVWQDEKGRRLDADSSELNAWNLAASRPRLLGDPTAHVWRAQFLAPQSQKLWLTIEGVEKETRGQPLIVNP